MVSLPGQKLKGQLQIALQCPKLLNVTAETDIVKEESWTELLWERASVSAGSAGNVPSLMLVTQFWQNPLKGQEVGIHKLLETVVFIFPSFTALLYKLTHSSPATVRHPLATPQTVKT